MKSKLVSFMGQDVVETPNLDKLASQNVEFKRGGFTHGMTEGERHGDKGFVIILMA